jgi:hypothetical protein
MVDALLSAVATVILGAMLSEFTASATKLAERLVRWGARTFGIPSETARYEEEWLGNLNEVEGELSRLAWALGITLRAVPTMRRDFRRAADGLVADCQAGKLGTRALAERYLSLANAPSRSRGTKKLAALLLATAVESLNPECAADLAWHLRDLGLKAPAFEFTWEFLRLERICRRRPEDAVVFFRVLARQQPGDDREVALLVGDATSQWSWESRRQVQDLLRRAGDSERQVVAGLGAVGRPPSGAPGR